MTYIQPKNKTIISSAAPLSHTGSLTETIVFSQLIHANTFKVGDALQLMFSSKKETIIAIYTDRTYISPNPSLTGAIGISQYFTNNRMHRQIVDYFVPTNNLIQSSFLKLQTNSSPYGSGGTNEVLADLQAIIDWTIDQYLIHTFTLGDITEIATLYHIKLDRYRL